MASFKTSEMPAPNTNFTQVKPRARPDVREEQLATLKGGVMAAGTIAGRQVAENNAAELTGANKTQAEVNDNANMITEEINREFDQAATAVEGPLQSQQVNEMVDENLTAFANDDRTLQELQRLGTISSTEARGRRQLNIKRALNNPINALFKKRFLNAAGGMTGGGTGAVDALFPTSAKEQRALDVEKAKSKAIADEEAAVAGMSHLTGRPTMVIREERRKEGEAKLQLAEFNRALQDNKMNGEIFSNGMSTMQTSAGRGVYAKINELNKAGGGQGIDAAGIYQTGQLVDQQYRGLLEQIKTTQGIGSVERAAEIKKLDAWKTGMDASMKMYSKDTYDAAKIKQFEQFSDIEGWETMTATMYANRLNPKLLELMMKQGGPTKALDKFMGEGTSDRLKSSVNKIQAMNNFSLNQPPSATNPADVMMSAISLGGTTGGFEYITSPEVQNDPDKKINLAKIYHETPEMSLQTYSTIDAQVNAPKNEVMRGEYNDALVAGRDKMEQVKRMVGAQDEVIFAENEAAPAKPSGSHLNPQPNLKPSTPKWVLNLPKDMQEYAGDLKAMHNAVLKHPWSWSHVEEDYIDGSDAFNGYMRGEWDVNVGMLPPAKDEPSTGPKEIDKGKVEANPIDPGTPLDEGKTEILDIVDNIFADDLQEEELAAKLTQIQEIRSRNRPSSGVRQPGVLTIADALSEATNSSFVDKAGTDPQKTKDGLDGTTGAPTAFPTTGNELDTEAMAKMVGLDKKVASKYKGVPKASGEFDPNVYATWQTVYNADNSLTPQYLARHSTGVMQTLNNPDTVQKAQLLQLDDVIDRLAPSVFAGEAKSTGISPSDMRQLLHITYASETNLGSSGKVSKSGASGEMQILPSTAMSLMGRGKNAGSVIFGDKAAKASKFDIDAFAKADRDTQINMLKANPTANFLLAIAKYYEQNKRTKKMLGLTDSYVLTFDPETGDIK